MDQTWQNHSTIEDLLRECAKPLPIPQPCSSNSRDEAFPVKDRRINLGILHVSKVNPNDNKLENKPELREALKLVRDRAARTAFPLLTEHMVSGYGGFVPKNQFQLGKTYQETCIKSIAEVEAEKSIKSSDRCKPVQKSSIKTSNNVMDSLQSGFGGQQHIRNPEPNTDYLSPYKMANDDPEKYYKSGFAGFVPRTQNRVGTNVEVTHLGLNEFTDAQKQLDTFARKNNNKC